MGEDLIESLFSEAQFPASLGKGETVGRTAALPSRVKHRNRLKAVDSPPVTSPVPVGNCRVKGQRGLAQVRSTWKQGTERKRRQRVK